MRSGAATPSARSALLQPRQIAAQHRQDIGVDRGRRGALVLARLRQHVDRGGDGELGEGGGERRGGRPLVGRVGVGVEEADRDRGRSPPPRRSRPAASTASRSTGRSIAPSASIRSSTSTPEAARDQRLGLVPAQVEHAGRAQRGRSPARRGSPRVVISPQRAPRFCRSVFEPTVVPCSTSTSACRLQARCAEDDRRGPVSTAASGRRRRRGDLGARSSARRPAISTRSVKVPPMSTPSRAVRGTLTSCSEISTPPVAQSSLRYVVEDHPHRLGRQPEDARRLAGHHGSRTRASARCCGRWSGSPR